VALQSAKTFHGFEYAGGDPPQRNGHGKQPSFFLLRAAGGLSLEALISVQRLGAAARYCERRMKTDIKPTIDVEACLASAGLARTILACREGDVICSQGDEADSLMYVLTGLVKLSVSRRREAVVGFLGSGEFFGEECLAGHAIRKRHATAMTQSTVLVIGKAAMMGLLRTDLALADRFMAHLLSRNVRVEDDLIDQLQSSCEQRLARTLLILAGYGHRGSRRKIVPRILQTALAGIVGTTRSRINSLLQKFKARGFIEMNGSLIVHRSLLSVVSPRLSGHRAATRGSSRRARGR
jgi:CRP/FNR family cyclic AMP-dependent transcriptional regulator